MIISIGAFDKNPIPVHDKQQQNLSRLGTEESFLHMKKLQSHDIY